MEKVELTDFIEDEECLLISRQLENRQLLMLYAITKYRQGKIKYVIERQTDDSQIRWTGKRLDKIEFETFDPKEAIAFLNNCE